MKNYKDIKNYEGFYIVSNNGIVTNKITNKILKPQLNSNGYYRVYLSKKGIVKKVYIHRLVAEHFILNINNKKQVNHIDGNKLNNDISNLEWVTSKENIRHSFKIGTSKIAKGNKHHLFNKVGKNHPASKSVAQYDLKGNFIKNYSSLIEASNEINVTPCAISHCCKGISKKCRNFVWKFEVLI